MRMSGGSMTVLVLGAGLASACECADRRYHDAAGASSTTDPGAPSSDSATGSAEGTSAATTTEEPVDVSRFIGVFHNEHWLTPFGREVQNPGGVSLANLEIRADGTASMTVETCNLENGTLHQAWTWEPHPGPRLELSPVADEALDFMWLWDLESLWAVSLDGCAFQFEADGVPVTSDTFRPGAACWVNRCDPSYEIHIDYCKGEEPPPCG
jgi:hypothetical protein